MWWFVGKYPVHQVCYQAGMPAKHSRHIALTEPVCTWIDTQIAKGEYLSSSDLIRTAIRVLRTQGEDRASVQSPPSRQPQRSSGQT